MSAVLPFSPDHLLAAEVAAGEEWIVEAGDVIEAAAVIGTGGLPGIKRILRITEFLFEQSRHKLVVIEIQLIANDISVNQLSRETKTKHIWKNMERNLTSLHLTHA